MKFQKRKISIRERLKYMLEAIKTLLQTIIWSYNVDSKKWHSEIFSISDRLSICFINVETAGLGYVYSSTIE